jgi:hypothetical protein
VDAQHFLPNAKVGALRRVHKAHRTKRGRVTTAGTKDVIVGRWHWLNLAVAKEEVVAKYVEMKKRMVGQGRGGWAAGFMKFGGKMSSRGWIGRHSSAGKISGWPPSMKNAINVSIRNNSAWASNGDPDRVVANALAGRERDMEKDIQIVLEKMWGRGAAGYNVRGSSSRK